MIANDFSFQVVLFALQLNAKLIPVKAKRLL